MFTQTSPRTLARLTGLFFLLTILGGIVAQAFIRFGLLTVATSLSIYFWLNGLAFTTNLSAWYASIQLVVMFIVTTVAAFAFYTSLGGQKVFKRNLLEE